MPRTARRSRASISGVSGADAQSTTCTPAGSFRAASEQVEDALLVGDAPDEEHVGLADAQALQGVPRVAVREPLRIDAVVDDHHLARDRRWKCCRMSSRIPRHRDDPVGRLHRRLLDPRREEIAAAELVGLPGRRGSMLCRVTTSGMRWSVRIQSPAMSAYQVCACATSASTGSRAMASSIESVSSDGA